MKPDNAFTSHLARMREMKGATVRYLTVTIESHLAYMREMKGTLAECSAASYLALCGKGSQMVATHLMHMRGKALTAASSINAKNHKNAIL